MKWRVRQKEGGIVSQVSDFNALRITVPMSGPDEWIRRWSVAYAAARTT